MFVNGIYYESVKKLKTVVLLLVTSEKSFRKGI